MLRRLFEADARARGCKVARRIRGEEPSWRTKLLAISASAFDEERAQALAAGCDDFLRKLFRATELLEMMGRHLKFAFRYADETTGKAAAAPQKAIDPERLRALPELLLRQLQHAVLHLDIQRTTEFAEQVAGLGPVLGAWILGQVRELRYEQLLDLLEGEAGSSANPS